MKRRLLALSAMRASRSAKPPGSLICQTAAILICKPKAAVPLSASSSRASKHERVAAFER
jgi:hypothetical protein